MRAMLKHYAGSLSSRPKRIAKALAGVDGLSWDAAASAFKIVGDSASMAERVDLRSAIMRTFRSVHPVCSVRLDDIYVDFYDRCLERYLYERLCRGLANPQTCWFGRAQAFRVIGWVDPACDFDRIARKRVQDDLLSRGKSVSGDDFCDALSRDSRGFVYIEQVCNECQDDKVLQLCHAMQRDGVKKYLLTNPPIILAFSSVSNRFSVVSGRHRIAALRYLASIGVVSSDMKVPCHVVVHQYDSLVYTRAILPVCERCDWGGGYDAGAGHQNFLLREGIPHVRESRKGKGGIKKWERLAPYFGDMVRGRRFVDVGAYKGLFCLKALQYGASSALAFEISPEFVGLMEEFREKYVLDDFQSYCGDFFDGEGYSRLKAYQADVACFLGIIHHLLRIGISNGVLRSFDELLERISGSASYGIIVEFSLPREEDLESEALRDHRHEFSEQKFYDALIKYYPHIIKTQKCNYTSGNSYGRYMYIAHR